MKTIRQIIRESVRNMSLPGPESSLDDGGTVATGSTGLSQGRQYPEVISQEREPIKSRQFMESKVARGVHYSPHIRTTRDYDKDGDRQIFGGNNIGKTLHCCWTIFF